MLPVPTAAVTHARTSSGCGTDTMQAPMVPAKLMAHSPKFLAEGISMTH